MEIYYVDGLSLGPECCCVIAQPTFPESSFEDMPPSLIVDWTRSDGATLRQSDYPLVRLASVNIYEGHIFLAGRLGNVIHIEKGQYSEEVIEGPHEHGFIRDLREIGGHLYAVGMGRQVYRRLSSGQRVNCDDRLLHFSSDVLDIRGLNSIDGLSYDDIYAVGFGGEIWHCVCGTWREVSSPTNVILERVHTVRTDLVYAAGQSGVLLRGHQEIWEPIEQTATSGDFWGMAWFQNRLYLSNNDGIFVLTDQDELVPLDIGLPGERTFGQLHSNRGALWSFGTQHCSWTENGKTWHDAVIM